MHEDYSTEVLNTNYFTSFSSFWVAKELFSVCFLWIQFLVIKKKQVDILETLRQTVLPDEEIPSVENHSSNLQFEQELIVSQILALVDPSPKYLPSILLKLTKIDFIWQILAPIEPINFDQILKCVIGHPFCPVYRPKIDILYEVRCRQHKLNS